MAHDIFISYSSKDQKIVEALSHYLEQNRIRCFVAYRDIPKGGNYADYIPPAIAECKAMVYVHSSKANMSKEIDKEIAICLNNSHPILPFRIENIDYKGAKEYHLSTINWIDAFPKPEEYFEELLVSIQKLFPELTTQQEKEKRIKYLVENVVNLIEEDDNISNMASNLNELVEYGNTFAMSLLGVAYAMGEDAGVQQNFDKAFKLLKTAAEKGDILAIGFLGGMHYHGFGTAQNYLQAFKLLHYAAEQETNIKMQYDMVLMDEEIISKISEYYKNMQSEFQNELGNMYSLGNGVAKNNIKAIELYKKAAEQGNADAQYNLGDMYDNDDENQDFDKAREWYSKAAHQEHSEAQFRLGAMYYYGAGCEQNDKEARKWLEKSAKQDNAEAQELLNELK